MTDQAKTESFFFLSSIFSEKRTDGTWWATRTEDTHPWPWRIIIPYKEYIYIYIWNQKSVVNNKIESRDSYHNLCFSLYTPFFFSFEAALSPKPKWAIHTSHSPLFLFSTLFQIKFLVHKRQPSAATRPQAPAFTAALHQYLEKPTFQFSLHLFNAANCTTHNIITLNEIEENLRSLRTRHVLSMQMHCSHIIHIYIYIYI